MSTVKTIEFDDKKITERLKKLRDSKQELKGYDVGFFEAYYLKTQKPVAQVAAWNEFGTNKIPERPFFRIANKKVQKKLVAFIKLMLDKNENYKLNQIELEKIALIHEGEIKQSITDLKTPPNSPKTIKEKKSSNPLIDTGFMRESVTFKIVK